MIRNGMLNNVCLVCSIPRRINSIELSLRNVEMSLNNVIRKYNINERQMRVTNIRKLKVPMIKQNFNYHIHQTCGHCTDNQYNSFKRKEDMVLQKTCDLLNYIQEEKLYEINLHELKNSCRGDYSTLYRKIDKIQAYMIHENKEKENEKSDKERSI